MADYKVRMEQLWQRSEQSAHARLMALWQAWIDDPVNGSWAENCLIVKLAAEVSDLSEDMRQILNDGVHKQRNVWLLLKEGQQEGSIPKHIEPLKTAQVMYQLWLGAAFTHKIVARQSTSTSSFRNDPTTHKTDRGIKHAKYYPW